MVLTRSSVLQDANCPRCHSRYCDDTRLREHTVEMLFNLKQELDGIATHNLQDLHTYVGVMSIPNVGRTRDHCWQLLYQLAEAKLELEVRWRRGR